MTRELGGCASEHSLFICGATGTQDSYTKLGRKSVNVNPNVALALPGIQIWMPGGREHCEVARPGRTLDGSKKVIKQTAWRSVFTQPVLRLFKDPNSAARCKVRNQRVDLI